MIRSLPWDSKFFNKKIGEAKVDSFNHELLNSNDFELMYIKSEKDFNFQIQNFKHTFTQKKYIFRKILKNKDPDHQVNSQILLLNSNIGNKKLYKLAIESGLFSRFKLDPCFNKFDYSRLYKKWIDNSLHHKIADTVLIYKHKNEIQGLITYNHESNYASIGLISVAPKVQGEGIGSKLICSVENNLFNLNIKELCVETQAENTIACEFYIKLGFTFSSSYYIKHFWKK